MTCRSCARTCTAVHATSSINASCRSQRLMPPSVARKSYSSPAMADSVREESMYHLDPQRLRLRHFTSADLDLLTELDSDPEVMRYVTYGLPTPRATYADTILPRWLEIYRVTPQLGYWAAEDRVGGGF